MRTLGTTIKVCYSANTVISQVLTSLPVLVLLLRLRQTCVHPALIQEGEDAFVDPGDDLEASHDKKTELARAARLVSPDFVEKMKEKRKTVLLERIAAEKEVSGFNLCGGHSLNHC